MNAVQTANRLKTLRLSKGMTLDQLSEAIGGLVTKQALSKYELGKAQPAPVVAQQLARVFAIKVAHLYAPPAYTVEILAYRRRSAMLVAERTRIESLVTVQLEQRVTLQDRLEGLAAQPLPRLKVNTLDQVEAAATELRRLWNLGLDPIANLTDALEAQRVHILELETSAKFDGISAFVRGADFDVVAAGVVSRSSLSGERQRMNFAHEVSHLVTVAEGIDEEEVAKRFAGALLFPDAAVRTELGARRRDIPFPELAILKARYGLSMQAIVMRAVALGIVTHEFKTEFFRKISGLGWRMAEPNPLEPEQPRRWKQIVTRGLAERLLTRDEASAYLTTEEIQAAAPVELNADRRAFLALPLSERRKQLQRSVLEAAGSSEYAPQSEAMGWAAVGLTDGLSDA